jgi:hypothetical protein
MGRKGSFIYDGKTVRYEVVDQANLYIGGESLKLPVRVRFHTDVAASVLEDRVDVLEGPESALLDPRVSMREVYVHYVVNKLNEDGNVKHWVEKQRIEPPPAGPAPGDPRAGDPNHPLIRGSRDVPGNPPLVKELQNLLNAWGGMDGLLLPTGVFDAPTEEAVKAFQAGRPLPAHNPNQKGYVDKATWDALRRVARLGRRAPRRPVGRTDAQVDADAFLQNLPTFVGSGRLYQDQFGYLPPVTFPHRSGLTVTPIYDIPPLGQSRDGFPTYDPADLFGFGDDLFGPSFSGRNRNGELFAYLPDWTPQDFGLGGGPGPSKELMDKLSRVFDLTFTDEMGVELWEAVSSDEFREALIMGLALYLIGLYFGASEVVTVGLYGVGLWYLGTAIVDVGEHLIDAGFLIKDAESDADPRLEQAAAHLRAVVIMVGIQALMAFLMHNAVKSNRPGNIPGRGRSPTAARRSPGPTGWRPSTQPGVEKVWWVGEPGAEPRINVWGAASEPRVNVWGTASDMTARPPSLWDLPLELPEGMLPEPPSRPAQELQAGEGGGPSGRPSRPGPAKPEPARTGPSEPPKGQAPPEKPPPSRQEQVEQLKRQRDVKRAEREQTRAREEELRKAGEARKEAAKKGDTEALRRAKAEIDRLKAEQEGKPSSDSLLKDERDLDRQINKLEDPQGTGEHLKRLKEYQAESEKKLAEAEKAGDKDAAKKAKAQITEAKGEIAATKYMAENYPSYTLEQGWTGPGNGFDQVWRGPNGEIVIVEAKGPGASLATEAQKGPQMSKTWVENTAREMANSSDPGARKLGNEILEAMKNKDGKPPVRGVVVEAAESGAPNKLPDAEVPDKGIYN